MRNLTIAMLALAVVAIGQSQTPPPTPGKPAQNYQGNATGKQDVASDDQRQANSVSTAINKLSSEITAWKNQQAAEDNKRDTSSGGWLMWSTIMTAIATLAIAGLGVFQWWAMHKQRAAMELQATYMKDALAETKKSADAAKSSADIADKSSIALMDGQRGWAVIQDVSLPPTIWPLSAKVQASGIFKFTYTFKMCGGTPCILKTAGARFHVAKRKEIPGFGGMPVIPFEADLPEIPEYSYDIHGNDIRRNYFGVSGLAMPPGEELTLIEDLEDGQLTPEQANEIYESKAFFCAYGFITYADIFNREHTT
jgi:hypothetical protein